MKMIFLLFRVFWKEHEHGSYRGLSQSIAASFDVWGYRDRFLRSIVLKYDSKKWPIQFNEYYDILQDFAGTPKPPRMSTTLPRAYWSDTYDSDYERMYVRKILCA